MHPEETIDKKPMNREQMRTGAALIAAVTIFDVLLWPGHFGIALPLSLLTLFITKLSMCIGTVDRRTLVISSAIAIAGLLPLVETVNALTVCLGILFTYAACFRLSSKDPKNWAQWIDKMLTAGILSPFRIRKINTALPSVPDKFLLTKQILNWLAPALLCCVFIVLFGYASPIWQGWIESFDPIAILESLFTPRSLFWLAIVWFAWPHIENNASRLRLFSASSRFAQLILPTSMVSTTENTLAMPVQRCLILFNLAFATQNILDLNFLWSGAELPEGMGYAEYAHRGAYPLVVAAILAGVFVLFAMRPGGLGERFTAIRVLVLIWVAQNLILLLSSLYRLDIYIDAYALTYWRIAAFIWMLLVAMGLGLIVMRFVLKKSSAWLIVANCVALVATLYATSFVNLPYHIALYNLQSSSHVRINGSRLDFYYIRGLGPQALPALDKTREQIRFASPWKKTTIRLMEKSNREKFLKNKSNDWRAWTYRKHRLIRYLEQVSAKQLEQK
ncbi:MAG: DUF4173 domain-containing protein [Pseudomonadota bacterium]